MPTLCLTTPGTRATLVSERLRIESPPSDNNGEQPPVRDLPLADIERVVVSEACSLTLAALGELMRRDIPVILTAGGDRVLGLCQPPSLHGAVRVEQYRRANDPAFALALAINWVEAKILNSRRVLQRLAANRQEPDATPALLKLQRLATDCRSAHSTETLRGYEGTAAGTYFETYGAFYPASAPFERRSRRPPHNAPNAVLSYAYTLLAAEAESALHATGLDPALGFYHEPADRRASLALDLIEPFRAPVADAMALDLFSHGTLLPESHFHRQNGGIYLSASGRKRFFVAYERRLERTFTSEQHGRRTSLRQEIQSQAVATKKAITEGELLEPFLMN